MAIVSEDQVEAFERDGVALVKQVFSDDWLDALAIAVDEVMADPSPVSREYAPDGKGRFFTDHHMSQRNETFKRFMLESPANETAAAMLRQAQQSLLHRNAEDTSSI